jgi:hypothetical protein
VSLDASRELARRHDFLVSFLAEPAQDFAQLTTPDER